MPSWHGAISILLLFPASVLASSERSFVENPYALDDERACGPLCVGFLDRYLGGSSEYNEIVELCPPGALGVSLEQADKALRALGYQTRTVHLTAKTLKLLRWPCLIYEKNANGRGHFVVCTGWQSEHNTFQIFNPPRRLEERTFADLEKSMGGMAIVVSRQQLPPADKLVPIEWSWQLIFGIELAVIGTLFLIFGRPRSKKTKPPVLGNAAIALAVTLVLGSCSRSTQTSSNDSEDCRTIDLGDVIQGADLEAIFHVRNDRKTSLRIERVERSCQCQDVRFDANQDIPPLAYMTIAVVVPTEKKVGKIQEHFVVHTVAGDKSDATVLLTLMANVRVIVRAIPSQVMFGSVSGTMASRQLRIETDPLELAAKYASVRATDFLNVELLNQDYSGLLFNVQLVPDAPMGVFSGLISIQFNMPELREFEVPVIGRKIGLIRVVPTRLVLEGGAVEQTSKVRIASTNDREFRLLSITAPDGVIPIWDETSGPQRQHFIDILFKSPGAVHGMAIVIETDIVEEPSFRIPISVIGREEEKALVTN